MRATVVVARATQHERTSVSDQFRSRIRDNLIAAAFSIAVTLLVAGGMNRRCSKGDK